MHQYDEHVYAIALGLLPGIGPFISKQLVSHCGSATNVFKASSRQLRRIHGVGVKITGALKDGHIQACSRAAEEIEFCSDRNIAVLHYIDDAYPWRLRHCHDSPYLLYKTGNLDLNAPRIISVVGTRKASQYGRNICDSFIKDLVHANVVVISGLAYGIDSCAHASSLRYRLPTAAVLAHGLDRIYPVSNTTLAKDIISHEGALITEYNSGTVPERMFFPARNRIVAGLSDAIIVVESGEKGGALITADLGNSYNRDVFAFPGRVGDRYSVGCNGLISQNKAALIRSAEDLLHHMGWDQAVEKRIVTVDTLPEMNDDQSLLYQHIVKSGNGIHIDELMKLEVRDSTVLRQHLLQLEFKGVIRSLPGNSFVKA